MDLLCVERITDNNFAQIDPIIFKDFRVIKNMLDIEESYMPNCNYFRDIQNDIQPFMRKVVTTWMLEVCEEQTCEDQVFPLAVNFMDRFLCLCRISRQQLQLLGATTLLMASKIRQCHPLPVDLLCAYTDNSITPSELRNWEMLVLSKLRWDITAITGFDYVDHVIERVEWGVENPFVRRHSHTLVALCYTEPDFILCRPSLIASACICAAARGLNIPSSSRAMDDICKMTNADLITAECIVNHIERLVSKETEISSTNSNSNSRTSSSTVTSSSSSQQQQQQSSSELAGKLSAQQDTIIDDENTDELSMYDIDDIRQPDTPTDVQDIHF